MFHNDGKPVHGLAGGDGLLMPNGAKRVSDVTLVEVRDRYAAKLRQDVNGERLKPSPCLTIALEF